mgnify:FL=1
MKIVICGSIAFINEMQEAKERLESRGYEVEIPNIEARGEFGELISTKELYLLRKRSMEVTPDWIWERNREGMQAHFGKVAGADAIVVVNNAKNGIEGYIGANTFLEIGLAFHLNKKIYLLHPIPEASYREEVISMNPSILNGNLDLF